MRAPLLLALLHLFPGAPPPPAAPPPEPRAQALSQDAWKTRGDAIEAAYKTHGESLDRFLTALNGRLRRDAPDLTSKVERVAPKPVRRGYQLLPQLLPEPAPSVKPRRATVTAYSWPWASTMIAGEKEKLAAAEAELTRAAALPAAARRAGYQKLVATYGALRRSQILIDSHIQYNRLWQEEIARNRAIYDRQSQLKDAVVERQSIADALAVGEEAALRRALGKLPGWSAERAAAQPHDEFAGALREREAALAREIHAATDEILPSPYLRIEHPSARRWIVRVRFFTDIEDRAFLRAFRAAVENVWHVRADGKQYRVAVSLEWISIREIYERAGLQPPKAGESIDVVAHCNRFPPGAAVLTTGAIATHVTAGRCIAIGPYAIAPHDLAHEFGHILGFKDVYFRGYRDLGPDGFEVQEILAEPSDIMAGSGPARKGHFERIVGLRRPAP